MWYVRENDEKEKKEKIEQIEVVPSGRYLRWWTRKLKHEKNIFKRKKK